MKDITAQKPIASSFDAGSTTADIIKGIDLKGKIAVVTGGYAGLGLETVKTLVEAGAEVVVPVRDTAKALVNLKGLEHVMVLSMDLMDPVSINGFADRFFEKFDRLDILVNCAGIMWAPLVRDSRGYESQLSTNHLGHFQLTSKLWPALRNSGNARVVNVSSYGHHYSAFSFDDPNFESREYETLLGYGQSKTANILFTRELDRRGLAFGVRSFTLHPGAIVETDMKRLLSTEKLIDLGVYDEKGEPVYDVSKGLKSIAQGASTIVWCATSPQLEGMGGVYCENNNISLIDNGELKDDPLHMRGVMPYAIDNGFAEQLWVLSEKMTETKFDI